MLTAIRHTFYMARRYQLALIRQPIWIIVTLVQPVIWLLLFGALFSSIVEIPGFEATDYKQFLTPGIVVMTALFASGWSGMSMIEDMKRGVHEHLMFGEGELDLEEALSVLSEVDFDGMVAVELSRHSHAAHETVPAAMSALRAAAREGVR